MRKWWNKQCINKEETKSDGKTVENCSCLNDDSKVKNEKEIQVPDQPPIFQNIICSALKNESKNSGTKWRQARPWMGRAPQNSRHSQKRLVPTG